MEEDNENALKYLYDIDVNYAVQKRALESLKNKYNLNSKKSENVNNIDANQQSQEENLTSRTNSSCNTKKTSKLNREIRGRSKEIEESVNTVNKNKSKYENVTTVIDFGILTTYGQQLLNKLDALEVNYELKNQIHPNLISWLYSNGDSDCENYKQFKMVLLILNWKEVIDYLSSSSLISHLKSISEMLDKQITLGIYGFENYFKYWKLHRQRGKHSESNETYGDFKNSIKIDKQELEYALTELELRCSCSHRFFENTQDLVNMIGQFTKSIAQLPEKLKKNEIYKNADFYMLKDNRDCVMVDKNGNGFKRLWQQQLTTFELVRLETAEAIMSKYSTPSQLFDTYENCNTKSEGIKLLEDIQIRRAAGPLTISRKIGPELSNKVYNFFNATEGSTVL